MHGESTGVLKPLPQPTMTSPSPPPPDGSSEPTSPTRRRVPRDIERPVKGIALQDVEQLTMGSTPLAAEQPASSVPRALDQPTNGGAVTDTNPSSTIVSLSNTEPTSQHANIDQVLLTRRSSQPLGLTLSIPAGDYVHDFRRLMGRATSVDECRVLVDMFLAQCGVLPTDEEHHSIPLTPPTSPVHVEVDSHELGLIEVLLGDGGNSTLPTAANLSQPHPAEPT